MSYHSKYIKYKNKYLKLKYSGGAAISINEVSAASNNIFECNQEIDINDNNNITLKSLPDRPEIIIKFNITKNISGGSGDSVFLIDNLGKTYVYKIFKPGDDEKKEKDEREISLHNKFYNYFLDLNKKSGITYIPCPKIFLYGKIHNIQSQYYIMEAIETDVISNINTMSKLISVNCENKEIIKDESIIKIIKVLQQLFHILYHMKKMKIKHCDLHTGNIMLEINKNEMGTKSNIFDDDDDKIPVIINKDDYNVKIIDFGEGTTDQCRLHRSMSSVLGQLFSICGIQDIFTTTLQLVVEQFKPHPGDEDLNFLINIIKIVNNSIMNLKNNDNIDELFKLSVKYKETQDDNIIKDMYKLFEANNQTYYQLDYEQAYAEFNQPEESDSEESDSKLYMKNFF